MLLLTYYRRYRQPNRPWHHKQAVILRSDLDLDLDLDLDWVFRCWPTVSSRQDHRMAVHT